MPLWYRTLRLPLLFIETLPAIGIFAFPLRKRSKPRLRIAVIVLTGCFACYWDARFLYFPGGGVEYALPRTICMLILYFLLIAASYFFYDIARWTALFVASAGYAAQNVAGSVKGLLKLIPSVSEFANRLLGEPVLDILCYGGTYIVLCLTFRSSIRHSEENFDNQSKAIFSFIVLVLCIGMSRITQDNGDRNTMAQLAEWLYAIISSVLILQVQFSVLDKNRMVRNVDTMRELLHQQHVQFQTSKENAQLVNEKHHDLKQMIGTLAGRITQGELERLQQSISTYGDAVHTGNKVLDIILTEKKILCEKQGIQITCLVGGVDLDFMDDLDLYSLLSNTLTNAIEAVGRLPEGNARYITLSIRQNAGMTFLHVENPCGETVVFENGLPQSRRDARFHGFGMKSMERVALKYGGTLAAKQSGDMFFLDIVLTAPVD